jgi:hypothetical protein
MAAALLSSILRNATYVNDQSAAISTLELVLVGGGGNAPSPDAVLINIFASYIGGPVPTGTLLEDLSGITVTAIYSDG